MSDQRFITPGTFFNEIDNSGKPGIGLKKRGPILVGRAPQGPMMVPVTVSSPEQFIKVFGYPLSGTRGGDVWRGGLTLAPTYAMYAALAFLKNSSPLTFIRLGGVEHPDRQDDAGEAGFKTSYLELDDNAVSPATISFNGGAYGLFVGDKVPTNVPANALYDKAQYGDLVLAAKFYVNNGALGLTGTALDYAFGAVTEVSTPPVPAGPIMTIVGKYNGPGYPTLKVKIVAGGAIGAATYVYSWDDGVTYSTPAVVTVGVGAPASVGYGVTIYWAIGNTLTDSVYSATAGVGTPYTTATSASATMIASTGSDYEFTMRVYDSTWSNSVGVEVPANIIKTLKFNFDPSSTNYIRKVFNTNPTLVNTDITSAATVSPYWLGETYDQFIKQKLTATTGTGRQMACLLKIQADGTNVVGEGADYRYEMTPSKTGWFFAQDLSVDYAVYAPTAMPKLFRFYSIADGEYVQKNLKISINNLRYSNSTSMNPALRYGRFDVELRSASDSDKKAEFVERFAGLSLDPNDAKYIGKAIGTKYFEFNSTTKKLVRRGKYDNNSNFIRVEMAPDVEAASIAPELLPFGFFGPTAFADTVFSSATPGVTDVLSGDDFVRGGHVTALHPSHNIPFARAASPCDIMYNALVDFSMTIKDAGHRIRETSAEENVTFAKQAYWGVTTSRDGTYKYDSSYEDIVRSRSIMMNGKEGSDTGYKYDFVFSLDDVCYKLNLAGTVTILTDATYDIDAVAYVPVVGRKSGRSITSGYKTDPAGVVLGLTPDYKLVIDAGFGRFTSSFWGGFDGLDVTEKEPFRNERLSDGAGDATANYAYYSLTRVLDMLEDPIKYKFNLLAIPGVTNQGINTAIQAINEQRKDVFGVIDVDGWYQPEAENNLSEEDRMGSVAEAITELQDYDFNTSWLATYSNVLQIKDNYNNNNLVWIPSSVAAIDTYAMSEAISGNVGFAAAGQTRGKLKGTSDTDLNPNSIQAGLNYVGVMFEHDSEDLDLLNENYFNPIYYVDENNLQVENAQTLYKTKSDLQEIQIRRHILWAKEKLSEISGGVRFDSNISTTWLRFSDPADKFLSGEKSAGVLEDYKIRLDKTTTTEDMKDQNIMKAKIWLKYANMIKWVWVDLIITNNIPA